MLRSSSLSRGLGCQATAAAGMRDESCIVPDVKPICSFGSIAVFAADIVGAAVDFFLLMMSTSHEFDEHECDTATVEGFLRPFSDSVNTTRRTFPRR